MKLFTQDMIKSQHVNNIEHYIVKIRNGTQKFGMEMMASSCKIFQMKEPPPFGRPSVEDAVCYGRFTDYVILTIQQVNI